jgi:hypothetical protein
VFGRALYFKKSMRELPEIETTVLPGTGYVLLQGIFRCPKLAPVLRKHDQGVLLKYLRLSSRLPPPSSPPRLGPRRRSSIFSLGKAIVVLYLVTLLTAVISARTPTETELRQPGDRTVDLHETAPSVIDE